MAKWKEYENQDIGKKQNWEQSLRRDIIVMEEDGEMLWI
jgi:hypothetical protein